jgi:hypothetical protein
MTIGEREALVQDAATQISKLAIQAQLLEPDAKRDPRIKQELEALRSERAAAEAVLRELLQGARDEEQAAETEAASAEADRQHHLAEARRLGIERVEAAKAFDQAARQFALSLEGYHRLCQQQANELTAMGHRGAADAARPRAHRVTCALAYALRQVKVPAGAIDAPSVSPSHVRSLLDADPVPIT